MVEPGTRFCRFCRRPMVRKRYANGALEEAPRFATREFCGWACRSGQAARAREARHEVKVCAHCSGPFRRSIRDSGYRLERPATFAARRYCSRDCGAAAARLARRRTPEMTAGPPSEVVSHRERRRLRALRDAENPAPPPVALDPVAMARAAAERNEQKRQDAIRRRKAARDAARAAAHRKATTCHQCGGTYGLLPKHLNGDPMDRRPENVCLICAKCRRRR